MHFAKVLPVIAFVSGAYGFVVEAYREKDCKGDSQHINVWDNTCRDSNVPATKSVKVGAKGGHHQRANFYSKDACDSNPDYKYWADGGDSTFYEGQCINFNDHTIHAMGSSF